MKVFGQYRVGLGSEFKVSPMREEYFLYLVVKGTSEIIGQYRSEFYAEQLAIGAHKRDMAELDEAMEKVITDDNN
jgi:hypothetical protein